MGKQLGLMEVRYVVSQLVRRFDFELAAQRNGHAQMKEAEDAFRKGTTETFTLQQAKLDVLFTPRAQKTG